MVKVTGLVSTLVATLALCAACTVHHTEAPAPTGPSEFAHALRMTAIPDSISQDGASQSSITLTALGPNGQPQSGVAIRVDIMVGGVLQDFGTLSARTVVTGNDGTTRLVYTAPGAPPANLGGSGTRVTILATPIGSDFQASQTQSVEIRLVPPGVILPPADTPTARFSFSPTLPVALLPVLFDASTSCAGSSACTGPGGITSFVWNFGDGTTGAGQTISHTFALPATYNVTLTVTNDRGVAASTTVPVSVGSGTPPTADFVLSPPSTAQVNQTVVFDATPSKPGVGHRIVGYNWNFGDNATGSGVVVTHAYGAVGTYSVVLTVTDEVGQTGTKPGTVTVVVANGPTALFTFSPPSPITHGTTITADASASTAASGSRIVLYQWDFGDTVFGGTPVIFQTTSPFIDHTYGTDSGKGAFTIKLTVTDEQGRTSPPATRQITVF